MIIGCLVLVNYYIYMSYQQISKVSFLTIYPDETKALIFFY